MKLILLLMIALLAACQPEIPASPSVATNMPPTPTHTTPPTETATSTPTLAPSLTPTPTFQTCCPLEDETIESLSLILANPLDIPPHFGQDTGHHGVDFAYFQRGERQSIEGIEIYAIMSGRVVMTLTENDLPYGFALMIETPLTDLPDQLQELLKNNYQLVPDDPHYRLYCPEVDPPQVSGEYAIYHVYAHMENPPNFQYGDTINCGQVLGTVGNTGYSSSPHLHLETRLGPAGSHFESMAHYEINKTPEQMGAYCLWRMSGYYQLFDPFVLLLSGE